MRLVVTVHSLKWKVHFLNLRIAHNFKKNCWKLILKNILLITVYVLFTFGCRVGTQVTKRYLALGLQRQLNANFRSIGSHRLYYYMWLSGYVYSLCTHFLKIYICGKIYHGNLRRSYFVFLVWRCSQISIETILHRRNNLFKRSIDRISWERKLRQLKISISTRAMMH